MVDSIEYHKHQDFMRQLRYAIKTTMQITGLDEAGASKMIYSAIESKFRTSKITWERKTRKAR